ncbi:MAG: FtsQ-type POTRA domain-containing protein [Candidatus Omnitrophica bacterium]|nr:FtsQ-type POTRA domain-containing protein [Candidatus Omnitrophota bacterium]
MKRLNAAKRFAIGGIMPAAILVISAWATFNWLNSFVAASPYFKIEKVEIVLIGRVPLSRETARSLFTIHKGRSIFDVDLKDTKDYILSHYPEVRTLVINKVFPDKLVLTLRPRRPVAQISLVSGFCLVDGEGIVLPGMRNFASEGLPTLIGVDSAAVLSKTGRRDGHAALKKALRLLEVIYQTRFSDDHEVNIIDVSDQRNLSLFIEGGIEIKIGAEDFRNRLATLEKTFESGRLDKSQIKYIDLRFGNVIIGPR